MTGFCKKSAICSAFRRAFSVKVLPVSSTSGISLGKSNNVWVVIPYGSNICLNSAAFPLFFVAMIISFTSYRLLPLPLQFGRLMYRSLLSGLRITAQYQILLALIKVLIHHSWKSLLRLFLEFLHPFLRQS